MKINTNNPSFSQHDQPEPLTDTRHFHELSPGERFKALIVDIKPGQVTIRLDDGSKFSARTMVLPEARIGETSLFAVKENNFKGQIMLEMVKLDTEAKQSNMLKEALRNAELFANAENLALSRAVMENGLPVDASTLQKAAFFKYAIPQTAIEKVIFLLQEDFFPDIKNSIALNSLLENPSFLKDKLTALSQTILQSLKNDTKDAKEILNAICIKEALLDGMDTPDALKTKFFLSLTGERIKTGTQSKTNDTGASHLLSRYYQDLSESISHALNTINTHGDKGPLQEQLAELGEAMRFMAQITRHREYYQIPFITTFDAPPQQAELYVFKDKKNDRDLTKQASVLISLDTLALGHVEVYAQKTENTVKFTFRCSTDGTIKTISTQSFQLMQALKQKGISVTGIAYKTVNEPFTLLSKEPGTESIKQETPKRFMFDMRV